MFAVGAVAASLSADDHLQRDRLGGDGLLEQAVEEQPRMPEVAAVEAAGELIEVVVEVVGLDWALVGAEQLALQQGEHPVDVGHRARGGRP
jgi:hypothetical protein